MANHKSAIKRHKQSLKARARNRAVKTRIKSVVKALRQALDTKDKDQVQIALKTATSVLDKAATKKTIHWRAAARRISRLHKAANALD